MPEILTDEHANPSETGIEGLNGIAPGEKSAFIKQAVGWQVHFTMYMHEFAFGKVRRRNEKTVALILFRETDHDIQFLAGFKQFNQDGII